jgi:hypothetical protein
MRYTKAHVLATVDANRAIQKTDRHPNGKQLIMSDSAAGGNGFSTTGAYEADE